MDEAQRINASCAPAPRVFPPGRRARQIFSIIGMLLLVSCGAGQHWSPAAASAALRKSTQLETGTLRRTGEGKVSAARLDRLEYGVIITDWLLWTGDRWWPNWYSDIIADGDLQYLFRIGVRHVRLPVRGASLMATSAGGAATGLDMDYVRHLDEAIARITAAGMGVVVDVAQADTRPFVEGDTASEASFVSLWRALSLHLAETDPERVFLEIYNEPVYLDDPNRWMTLQEELIREIRANAPAHTIIATKGAWSSLTVGLDQFRPSADPNVVYTFHYYEPTVFTGQGANGLFGADLSDLTGLSYPQTAANCAEMKTRYQGTAQLAYVVDYCAAPHDLAVIDRQFGALYAWASQYDVPVWIGEGGVYLAGTDDVSAGNWYRDFKATVDKYGFGWGISTYDTSLSPDDDRHCLGICRTYDYAGHLSANPAVLAGLGFDTAWVGNVGPLLTLSANASSYGAGDHLTIRNSFRYNKPAVSDKYLAVQMGDRLFFVDQNGRFVELGAGVAPPVRTTYGGYQTDVVLLDFVLPPGVPPGDYVWYAAEVKAGANVMDSRNWTGFASLPVTVH
jgi:endoglucanase